jgi:hypothetical protein
MLNLSNREAKLGKKHSGNVTEKDGVESRTLTFELQEVMLDATELNVLLSEPHAHNSLYVTRRDGAIQPFLKCFKALEVNCSIDGAFVQVEFHGKEFKFADVRLTKVKLELREGGDTALSCKVTAEPALDASLAKLVEQMGETVFVELRAEPPGAQQDLDLPANKFGKDEQPETPRRGQKRRHANRSRAH